VKYLQESPKVFIVMQFSDNYNILYKDVIKPLCESYGLTPIRADEFFHSTPILKDIITSINDSSLIIAEITPDNPNVFYEIGYSHALNKPTIILCDKKREKLPFDLSGFRTLFYENSIGGKNKVENDLRKFIESIFNK
jgi:nucleoside 2-deoxyribosyltransferase